MKYSLPDSKTHFCDLPSLAIIVGTRLQKSIAMQLIPAFSRESGFGCSCIISLERYYRLGLHFDPEDVILLKSIFNRPWYNRKPALKIISLPQFLLQMALLRYRFRYFLFFVDTGILERCAIVFLKRVGGRTVVLQDGMKLRPSKTRKSALTWFGGGGADLYLLMGPRYLPMIRRGRKEVVGSPILYNRISPLPPGRKILFINQAFTIYGMVSEEEEYTFVREIIKTAEHYGPVELRLHPHCNKSRFNHLKSSRVELTTTKPLNDSLKDSGIVLAVSSTSILDALIYCRPVITLEWHPSPFHHPIRSGVIPCWSIHEMRKILQSWKDGDQLSLDSFDNIQREINELVAFSGQEAVREIKKAIVHFMMQD